jgi:hypothetical protein
LSILNIPVNPDIFPVHTTPVDLPLDFSFAYPPGSLVTQQELNELYVTSHREGQSLEGFLEDVLYDQLSQ